VPISENHPTLLGLLTAAEVAEYLEVPQGTLANWRYLGRGPAFVRLGRHVRYRSEDVAAWIDGGIVRRRSLGVR
jgi:excisionase family DNA binding protein